MTEPDVYPYGDEITSTSNDREKFATYTRDSYTGLDYANQRYFASTYGRFNTADPYQASGGPNNPASWNRYSYVQGDPVNSLDPRGLMLVQPIDDGGGWPWDWSYVGGGDGDPCSGLIPGPQCYYDPGNGSGGTSSGSAPNPPPPTCSSASIELYSRPVPWNNSPAAHTYIDATLDYSDGTESTVIIEGGPTPQNSPFGILTGYISFTGVGALAGSDPSSPTNKQVGGAYTGANACSDVTTLENDVKNFNNNAPKVFYSFQPSLLLGGFNSNSFTSTLLYNIGLLNYFGRLPNFTPGWGFKVPGL